MQFEIDEAMFSFQVFLSPMVIRSGFLLPCYRIRFRNSSDVVCGFLEKVLMYCLKADYTCLVRSNFQFGLVALMEDYTAFIQFFHRIMVLKDKLTTMHYLTTFQRTLSRQNPVPVSNRSCSNHSVLQRISCRMKNSTDRCVLLYSRSIVR